MDTPQLPHDQPASSSGQTLSGYDAQLDQAHYHDLFNAIDEGFCIIDVLFDEHDTPYDYRFIEANPAFIQQTGLLDAMGKTMRELAPTHEPYWFEIYGRIARTGVAERFENKAQAIGFYYEVYAFRIGKPGQNRVAILFKHISQRKQQQEQLLRLQEELAQKATDKYHTLFNSIDQGFAIIEILPDRQGRVTDLIYREANPVFERQTGMRDFLGKRASEFLPNLEQELLDVMTAVYRTGEPVRGEQFLADLDRWYSFQYSRVGGVGSPIIAAVFDDITERKLHQRQQEYLLNLSDALRPLVDPLVIQQTAMKLLGQELQVSRAFYGDMQADQDTLFIGPGYASDTFPLEVYVKFSEFDANLTAYYGKGQTVVMNDVNDHPLVNDKSKAEFALIDCRAAVGVPLLKNGKVRAILSLHQRVPRQWKASEISLTQETAERTWSAVERAKAEEALRESEEKYRTLFSSIDEGYCLIEVIVNDEGKPVDELFLEMNPAYEKHTGLTKDIIGKRTSEIVPNREPEWGHFFGNVALTGQPDYIEYHVNGIDRWLSTHASRVGGEGSLKVAMVFNDVTERKRAEEALKEANRRKDEFLAMLAHELRNPMATLHNTLLLLELTHGQDETLPLQKALAMMSREVSHLNRMVDDLLDVGRISQGKIKLKKDRLDLNGLIQEAIELARPQFISQGHTLTSQLPNEPTWVDADRTRLMQVVRNLLTNAAKYTPSGGRIEVALGKENRQAVLRVRDNGIGIAPDQLEAIFEVFVQVSSSIDRPQGGLGLGLAVVKQLVHLHDGQVGVQSAGLGQGSEFTVSLPLLPDVSASTASTGVGQSARKPGRIIVVDDNADLALTTAMLLRVKKYEAHTCLSGFEALEVVDSIQPDAVLLDLGMPGMDGYETCRRLRELEWGQQGVIVALSGYGQEEDKKRTREAGFDAHLVKPVNLQTLTALLDRLLSKAKSGQ